jgi:glycosyltransferase involved in cell wall biosynthesis
LAVELKKLDVSVLHMHGMGPLLLARMACWWTGVPIVATVHLTAEPSSKRSLATLGKMAEPVLSRFWPNRLIAISSEIREIFRKQYAMSYDRIDTVFNGVDISHFRPPTPEERAAARRTLGLSDNDFVLSHVGRLVKVKGHDVLFDAAAKLVDEHPELKVICRGTGPDLAGLEAMCAELKITQQVRFLGHGDTRLVYWASDLFVLPSRREGFPLVVIEAMLCGAVPIRTPAAGATDQIEDGVNGFICPFDDPAALARVVDLLIRDRSMLQTVRKNAIESAQSRFSAALMATKTLETYHKAMDKREIDS